MSLPQRTFALAAMVKSGMTTKDAAEALGLRPAYGRNLMRQYRLACARNEIKLPKVPTCQHTVIENGKPRLCGKPGAQFCPEHLEARSPKHGLRWSGKAWERAA